MNKEIKIDKRIRKVFDAEIRTTIGELTDVLLGSIHKLSDKEQDGGLPYEQEKALGVYLANEIMAHFINKVYN